MVGRESQNHVDGCYFCFSDIRGTITQGPDVPIPLPPDSIDTIVLSDEESSEETISESDFETEHKNTPQLFTQCELNDLVRDQGLSKTRSSPYHPKGNRLAERLNHNLHVMLDIMVDRNLPQQQRPREHKRNTGNRYVQERTLATAGNPDGEPARTTSGQLVYAWIDEGSPKSAAASTEVSLHDRGATEAIFTVKTSRKERNDRWEEF
ncbi:hypothetical protein T08_3061 [Trichinella sp. T8]|nr:hypothetical protein T08_3061 [Trichinella sp. T8]